MDLKTHLIELCAVNSLKIPESAKTSEIGICTHIINTKSVNIQDKHGQTALFWGAYYKNVSVCQNLIESGADVNLQAKNGTSPLYVAAQNGHTDVCSILLKEGAKLDLQTKNGWSPLNRAAEKGHKDVCTILLEAGAKVDLPNNILISSMVTVIEVSCQQS
ncbi:uncharacterized protein [Antedon mediterranea]|uniref:uncharacterized protein isoform X2 n=1 Tax=Antedon mediterranea TaxID=105859 RepID=UPI003AF725F1